MRSILLIKMKKKTFFSFVSCCSTNLQGELWPLCALLQGLLGVVELRHHWVHLLGKSVRGEEIREALQMTRVV